MTDQIRCPECEGRGETAIGSLRLLCRFCQGRQWVGGDHEPAEDRQPRSDGYRMPEDGEEYDPAIHGPMPAVWEHPAAQDLEGCPTCLGAGTVINLGDIYSVVTDVLVELPCPACVRPTRDHRSEA